MYGPGYLAWILLLSIGFVVYVLGFRDDVAALVEENMPIVCLYGEPACPKT